MEMEGLGKIVCEVEALPSVRFGLKLKCGFPAQERSQLAISLYEICYYETKNTHYPHFNFIVGNIHCDFIFHFAQFERNKRWC